MDVSHCINMLGPGLDAPVQAVGRPTEVRSGECDFTVCRRCSHDMTRQTGKKFVCFFFFGTATHLPLFLCLPARSLGYDNNKVSIVGAGLFLGGLTAFPYLQELGITHVLVSALFRRQTACARS